MSNVEISESDIAWLGKRKATRARAFADARKQLDMLEGSGLALTLSFTCPDVDFHRFQDFTDRTITIPSLGD